jgi:O-antigen ligase
MTSLAGLRSGVFFSLIYFAITNLNDFEKKEIVLYRYISILIYAGAIASLYGAGYALIHGLTVKAQSISGGITRFAEYTMIVFCLSFSLARNRNIFPKRYIAFLVLGITGVGLILAQERAQWLGVIPVLLMIGLRKERSILVCFAIVFGVMISFFRTIRYRIMTLLKPLHYTTGRLMIWRGAKSLILKKPLLGYGPRTYSIVSPFLKDRGSWHSDYLQIYMESGILGLASYVYLTILLFKQCIFVCRSRSWKDFGFAFLFTLIAMYVVSFFSGHTQEPVINPLFFSFIGFISLLSRANGEEKREQHADN